MTNIEKNNTNSRMTELGQELSLNEQEKPQKMIDLLKKSRERLQKQLRQGTPKAEYESYTSCLNAVSSAITFLEREIKNSSAK